MSQCSSCGRYVGPYEACPYCGAHLTGRTPIRLVKIGAIILATLGLAALWLAAARAEVPLVKVGQAGAMMNMAYVRLEGRCSRAPSYDPQSDYLSFWIEDDTGEILVSSYRAETRHIIERGLVPALGDMVEVAGTLRVRQDFYALTINVPDQLTITRPEPLTLDIGAILPADLYSRVQVRGEVRDVYQPFDGLTLISLRDGTGAIPVAVSEDLVALSGTTPTVSAGQVVTVVGTVSLYGDSPQLVPASVADIEVLDEAPGLAEARFIGELTPADEGRVVVVNGRVTAVDRFSSGVKYTLDDGTGAVTLLLWQDIHDELPDPAALDVGAEVQVQGRVSQYQGELEVIPEAAGDIELIAPALPPDELAIGAVTERDQGRTVTLRGKLGAPDFFSAGVKFPLTDGTGTIVLLLWQDVYDQLPDTERLVADQQVVVTGQIGVYEGELQIVPPADGVTLIER